MANPEIKVEREPELKLAEPPRSRPEQDGLAEQVGRVAAAKTWLVQRLQSPQARTRRRRA